MKVDNYLLLEIFKFGITLEILQFIHKSKFKMHINIVTKSILRKFCKTLISLFT